MQHSKNVVNSNEIVGATVKNKDDEDLGKIEAIILDKQAGKVCYVVLSFGGFLGLGNKLFAVPWNAFIYKFETDSFILNIDKEKLEKAPGFDKNNWPDVADLIWGESIHEYYQTKPYWKDQNS